MPIGNPMAFKAPKALEVVAWKIRFNQLASRKTIYWGGMQYRKEIDGLRAVAVLPVILFHAGFSVFGGGYVGVDVFFVISGYLITSILIDDLEQDDFSILRFYERRARRILPALFAVMLACLPFAYMWMTPSQLEKFGQSLGAVVLFVSNWLFWQDVGYFASEVELKPLLHTWSLAVEEQYYLMFPVLLLLLWRLGRPFAFGLVMLLAAMSLLLAEWGWRNEPEINFYFTFSRFWELLAGSMCALLSAGQKQRSSNILGALGLALIGFSIFYYDGSTPFPSLYTVVPVAGAALIILFGDKNTWVSRLLSARGFVGIGLISYSAYLWHQPLFAFARLRSLTEPNHYLMGVLAVIAIILAWATWRWIEQPFRKSPNPLLATRRSVFVASGAVGALFFSIGLAGHLSGGFPSRESNGEDLASLDARIIVNYGLHKDCERTFNDSANCVTSPVPEVLLWGDSYAMHLAQGVLASEQNIALQQQTISGCAPIIGMAQVGSHKCIDFNDEVVSWLRAHENVQLVVLSSRFSLLYTGESIMVANGGEIAHPDVGLFAAALIDTVNEIRETGAKVIIVSPTPSSGWNNGQCLARSVYFDSDEAACDFELDTGTVVFDLLRSVESDVPVYWLHEDYCAEEVCDIMQDDTFIYRDAGHLSKEGSAYLGRVNAWIREFRAKAN
jgi:peptidoglycan/LPS O-acetylase OafA/YrhL